MVRHAPAGQHIDGLSGRELALMLFVKYGVLVSYGIWAALREVPTFVIVGSSTFSLLWAGSVASFALLAAAGVTRTLITGRHRFEKWSTAAFVLCFLLYSCALIYRSWSTGNWDSAPLSLVPVAVCVLPTFRFYSLVRRRPEAGS